MRSAFLILMAFAAISCSGQTAPKQQDTGPTMTLPSVTDDRTDLILSWFADGGSAVGSSVRDVPAEARKEVRVQDPTIPPEERDPTVLFVADLTAQKQDGKYPVKAVKRSDWEAERRAALEAERRRAEEAQQRIPPQTAAPAMPLLKDAPPVVMYATKHCPVCAKARRWLLNQGIPYVEKDLEVDHQAAAELQRKGAAQGVPVNGVPVFDIRGVLLPGFDPQAIAKRLAGPVATQKTI